MKSQMTELDAFTQEVEGFLLQLLKMKQTYIQAEKHKVLLEPEKAIMKKIVDGWKRLYASTEELKNKWLSRVNTAKMNQLDAFLRFTYEAKWRCPQFQK